MRIARRKAPAANRLQKLRFEVFEQIKAATDITVQDELADALCTSPSMVSQVLLGHTNFTLKDALNLRKVCPSIGVGWVYFLSPKIHDELLEAITETGRSNGRPKPR